METQLMIFVKIAKAGVNTVKVLEEHLHKKEFTVGFFFSFICRIIFTFYRKQNRTKKAPALNDEK